MLKRAIGAGDLLQIRAMLEAHRAAASASIVTEARKARDVLSKRAKKVKRQQLAVSVEGADMAAMGKEPADTGQDRAPCQARHHPPLKS